MLYAGSLDNLTKCEKGLRQLLMTTLFYRIAILHACVLLDVGTRFFWVFDEHRVCGVATDVSVAVMEGPL